MWIVGQFLAVEWHPPAEASQSSGEGIEPLETFAGLSNVGHILENMGIFSNGGSPKPY